MRTLILSLISFTILLFSSIASAEKVVITGTPIVVEKQADVYVPSATITSPQDYYYLTIDGVQKVCYKELQPTLEKVGVGEYKVRLGADTVNLHCYDYNTEYFIVQ